MACHLSTEHQACDCIMARETQPFLASGLSSWPPTALAVPGGLQRGGGYRCTLSTGCQCTSSVWAVSMGPVEALWML